MEEITGSAAGKDSDMLIEEVDNNRNIASDWLLRYNRGLYRASIGGILHRMKSNFGPCGSDCVL